MKGCAFAAVSRSAWWQQPPAVSSPSLLPQALPPSPPFARKRCDAIRAPQTRGGGGCRRRSMMALRSSTAVDAEDDFDYSSAAMGARFPSDDSDYEQQQQQGAAMRVGRVDEGASPSFASAVDANQIVAPISDPVGSGGVSTDDFDFVDPFDVIADWVSERFYEQSLQRNPSASTDGDGFMESYTPGSALDAIARASSTYTPLSYQIRTVVRVVLPSVLAAAVSAAAYPTMAHWLVDLPAASSNVGTVDGGAANANNMLYTDQVLTVLSNDLSQYVQNILTTCALLFGMLVGQTYYFMYQQQELVFYALFAEVTEAKSLLEQISLMAYGREKLYPALLSRMNDYVQNDLKLLSTRDPIAVTSGLPRDDPLESIMYATSVGLPGAVYDTVRSLRQARANRCGALQRKLPALHVYCLRLLGVIVLASFPVCGSGSQAIAPNVLVLQSYMFGVLAFGLTLVLNVVEELRDSRKRGAYNVDGILEVMVGGLEQELEERLAGKFRGLGVSPSLPVRGTADEETVQDGASSSASDDTIARNENNTLPLSRRVKVKNWLRRKVPW